MVNAPLEHAIVERRKGPRANADHSPALAAANLNPFGDLITLQHLCARLAKALKPVFDGVLRADLRCWAEPLAVQRWADYRAERGHALTAWQPLTMGGARARVQLALDAGLVIEMLDAFFGGDGEASNPLPAEFTPAAEALIERLAATLAARLDAAWEPLTGVAFRVVEGANLAALPDFAGDDPVIVTRFGIAVGDRKPAFIDILYPVAALKPHGAALAAKVHGVPAEVAPEWRGCLTRAVMGVPFPVRSVLAEPMISLGRLLELQAGDVIPIDFGPEVPVMVASRRLGTGLVGTANGRAAVRLTQFEPLSEEDFR